jgi:hypothetical protein
MYQALGARRPPAAGGVSSARRSRASRTPRVVPAVLSGCDDLRAIAKRVLLLTAETFVSSRCGEPGAVPRRSFTKTERRFPPRARRTKSAPTTAGIVTLPGADGGSESSPPALGHPRLRTVSSMDGLQRKKSLAVMTAKPIRPRLVRAALTAAVFDYGVIVGNHRILLRCR